MVAIVGYVELGEYVFYGYGALSRAQIINCQQLPDLFPCVPIRYPMTI